MILPEKELSLLKVVNNQPYLDIWTSAWQLTKRFLFSCISLFFLLSYVFYIHPIGHFRVAFCLCVKTSLNAKAFIWFAPTDSFHNNQTHFYMKGFTRRLVLKQAQGYIHPWAAHRSLWFIMEMDFAFLRDKTSTKSLMHNEPLFNVQR